MYWQKPYVVKNIKFISSETEKCNNFCTMRCLTIRKVDFFSNDVLCVSGMSYASYQKGEKGIKYSFEVWLEVPERGYNAWHSNARVLLSLDWKCGSNLLCETCDCNEVPFMFVRIGILSALVGLFNFPMKFETENGITLITWIKLWFFCVTFE